MNTKTGSEGRGISLNPDMFVQDDKQGELQDCRKYMVPTQDDKGHSMQMRLSLPKSFGARFQKALASGKFPFLRYGPSQLARYCLKRGLDELEKEIPGLDIHVDTLSRAEEMLAIAQEGQDFNKRMSKYAIAIEAMSAAGEEEDAKELVNDLYERTKNEPKVWRRQRQLKAIEDRFRHLLK